MKTLKMGWDNLAFDESGSGQAPMMFLYVEWVWAPNPGHYLPHEDPASTAAACRRIRERCGGEASQ